MLYSSSCLRLAFSHLMRSLHDLQVEFPRDLSSFALYDFLDSTLLCKAFVVLAILEDIYELLGSHQIVKHYDFTLIISSKCLLAFPGAQELL